MCALNISIKFKRGTHRTDLIKDPSIFPLRKITRGSAQNDRKWGKLKKKTTANPSSSQVLQIVTSDGSELFRAEKFCTHEKSVTKIPSTFVNLVPNFCAI